MTNVEHLGVAAAREPLLIQLNNFALLGALLTGVATAQLMGGIPNSDSGHRQVSDELRDAIGISVQCSLMLSLLATVSGYGIGGSLCSATTSLELLLMKLLAL